MTPDDVDSPLEVAKGALARAAETAVETVADAAHAGAAAARRAVGRGPRRRRAQREPLPNLYEVHPEARTAPRRELGVMTIPVSRVTGTAVEGPAQRGADFRPLPGLRGANWESRWQRLRAANERLLVLPPIDVLQTDDGYWVVDGHNRVALARLVGQDDIDAAVVRLHLPGSVEHDLPQGPLETVLADSRDLRSVTRGRPRPGRS
ncbi:MAG TPA: hypothetical protein VF484_05525 [Candidatus Limnocylindrales bacterium]